jgi:hypothetical protein
VAMDWESNKSSWINMLRAAVNLLQEMSQCLFYFLTRLLCKNDAFETSLQAYYAKTKVSAGIWMMLCLFLILNKPTPVTLFTESKLFPICDILLSIYQEKVTIITTFTTPLAC